MTPPKRVFHKSIAEMRRGSTPMLHPEPCPPICTRNHYAMTSCTSSCVPPNCSHSPCMSSCNTSMCDSGNCVPDVRVHCRPRMSCVHAPYYCTQYRNMSFWCEYCMSRYMFPEHYPTPTCPPPPPICYTPHHHISSYLPQPTVCVPREESCSRPVQTCYRQDA